VEKRTGMGKGSQGPDWNSDRIRGRGAADHQRGTGSSSSRDSVHAGRGTGRGQPERATERGYSAGLPQWYRASIVALAAIGIILILILQMLYGG